MEPTDRIRIVLFTQQPFVAEGMATVCHTQADLMFEAWPDTLAATLECLRACAPTCCWYT